MSTPNDPAALQPCPFCGGDKGVKLKDFSSDTDPLFNVFCYTCAAHGPATGTEGDCVAAWNRRATPQPIADMSPSDAAAVHVVVQPVADAKVREIQQRIAEAERAFLPVRGSLFSEDVRRPMTSPRNCVFCNGAGWVVDVIGIRRLCATCDGADASLLTCLHEIAAAAQAVHDEHWQRHDALAALDAMPRPTAPPATDAEIEIEAEAERIYCQLDNHLRWGEIRVVVRAAINALDALRGGK